MEDLTIVDHGEVDRDMFGGEADGIGGDAGAAPFPETFSVGEERAVSMDKAYVLHLALAGGSLAVATSDESLVVFDSSTLTPKSSGSKCHDSLITGLSFSPNGRESVFYTSSKDSSVKVWDSRQGLDKEVRLFGTKHPDSQDKRSPPKPLNALDVSSSGNLLCAGTEQVLKDAFLLFWDPRSADALLGGYWDSHEDDVTTVRFGVGDRLASGGTDGIVNVFDISQASEDDALEASANTESSVQKLVWHDGGLAVMTHTEELHLWDPDADDADPGRVFNRDDVCAAIRRSNTSDCYLVDCRGGGGADQGLALLAGSSCEENPCLRMAEVKTKGKKAKLRPLADFRANGKKKRSSEPIARCAAFAEGGGAVYVGGEDGVVRMWRRRKAAEEEDEKRKGKVKKDKKKTKPY